MLGCDYLVDSLIRRGVRHVFGYPGGMVTHLIAALDRRKGEIEDHILYHEQACAFAACATAQVTGIPGVAYATSGPGATNLLTGVANAYFDSIPCIFLTGQVNTYESKGQLPIRQRGFQETDIVSIARPLTKYAKRIQDVKDLPHELDKVFQLAQEGRPGPVLLDIPMDVQRSELNEKNITHFLRNSAFPPHANDYALNTILTALGKADRPLIIAGGGIRPCGMIHELRHFAHTWKVPVITSMLGVDLLDSEDPFNLGFLGPYGHRYANFAIARCDLILSLGSRLDCRQTGGDRQHFASQAHIIRLDIDPDELCMPMPQEEGILGDLRVVLPSLAAAPCRKNFAAWNSLCQRLKKELQTYDANIPNQVVKEISSAIPDEAVITTDVGQNQVWVAQSFQVKQLQTILFSGGHGAMGYSLPAAIGTAYATKNPVYCITGDGGLQMNIQELQTINRDNLPVHIILLNNNALGMIRHFQEMYFNSNFTHTIPEQGYETPDFCSIAAAYGIKSQQLEVNSSLIEILTTTFKSSTPSFTEINLPSPTYVFPKLSMNRPLYDQDPLLDRNYLEYLLKGNIK